MTPQPADKDPAKARFMVLQLLRLSGAVLAIFGLSIMAGRFGLPPLVGAVLFLAGMVELLIVPMILTKRWKSPPQ